MPTTTSSEPMMVITDDEKNAAIQRIEAQLREWRRLNPDAPKGR